MNVKLQASFPIITKEISTSLAGSLANYTKPQLVALAGEVASEIKKSSKKEVLINTLTEDIQLKFEQFYKPVVMDLLDKFSSEMEQATGFSNVEQLERIAPLINKGMFFVYQQDDLLVLVIPDELWESTQNDTSTDEVETAFIELDPKVVEEGAAVRDTFNKEAGSYALLHQWKQNAENIYGNVSPEYLSTVWNRYYPEQLTPQEIEYIINDQLSDQ